MGFSSYTDGDIEGAWTEIERNAFKVKEPQPKDIKDFNDLMDKAHIIYNISKKETVDHPSHYNREGGMECLDEMELIFGKEAVMNFCLCNAWKYRYRAADKNGEEDLKKSDWYLKKYKELKKGRSNTTTIPKGYHSANTLLGTVTIKDVLDKND